MNTVALSIPPESTHELYAQLLFVALQRVGLDAQSFLDQPERARAASDAFEVLWLSVELGALCDSPGELADARFARTRDLASVQQLRGLAAGLDGGATQLRAVNAAGLMNMSPEQWHRCMPARGTDVMSTLALAWLAEAAVLGDELVGWLADGAVLRRVVDALAILIEQTLHEGSTPPGEHLPLSRSVLSEGQRKALLDVWRAQRTPSLVSAVISKPCANDTDPISVAPSQASRASRAPVANSRARPLLLILAAVAACSAALAWWLLAR